MALMIYYWIILAAASTVVTTAHTHGKLRYIGYSMHLMLGIYFILELQLK